MRICERGLNFVQITNADGDVRLCSWLKDGGVIGNLKENSLYEIYHGERASQIRSQLMEHDYSNCFIDACPYLAMGTLAEHEVEIDKLPEYPEKLYLAYEEVCNYQCTGCGHHLVMKRNRGKDLTADYDLIERRIRDVLPYVKLIGANGRGELFASKRIIKMLQEWTSVCQPEGASVILETNGSMFDERHWKQIEKLGDYHLKVAITVMSFNEYVYQYLSGVKLPMAKIEDNLRFVKSLREEGIIDELELATVVQERNFRYLPEFTRRCIEEFGADTVRLRPYGLWGAKPREVEWFADVRNPYHPYNEEYLEVVRNNPILQHPKVREWSGGLPSETGEYPAEIRAKREARVTKVLSAMIMHKRGLIAKLKAKMQEKNTDKIAVYGYGVVGKAFVETIKDDLPISHIYDRQIHVDGSNLHKIMAPDGGMTGRDALIIITPVNMFQAILQELAQKYGVDKAAFLSLEDILDLG